MAHARAILLACLLLPLASTAWHVAAPRSILARHTARASTSRGHARRSAATDGDVAASAAPLTPTPGFSMLKSRPVGVGACAAPQVMPNTDLETMDLDTTDEWIATRTGISSRHLLPAGTALSELSATAAAKALEGTGVSPEEIDLVIVATSSPDDMFGDATSVAAKLGATNAAAFDLTAACSGFLFALVTGSQFIHTGTYKNVMIVGADALSRWVDWSDRNVCILFGDGAGAVLLQQADSEEGAGVLGFQLHSDGASQHQLTLPYKGETISLADGKHTVTGGAYSPIGMNGKEVYKFATREVPQVLSEALANAGLTVDDVDHLLLHQANIRIMETVASRLGLPMDKVITNLSDHGNTSAGSIPIALDEAVRSGRVKKGDIIACAGFGAGLSWGSAIIRWG